MGVTVWKEEMEKVIVTRDFCLKYKRVWRRFHHREVEAYRVALHYRELLHFFPLAN